MINQSINASVGALTSQLYLDPFQQKQIKSILTYNLREIQGLSGNTEENPTIGSNEKTALYQKTLDEVNNVLTEQQRETLKKMMAPMQNPSSLRSSATSAPSTGSIQ